MIKPGSTGHKLASLNLFFLICILGSTLIKRDCENVLRPDHPFLRFILLLTLENTSLPACKPNFTFVHNPGIAVGRPSQLSLKRSPIKTMYECPAYYWNSQ